MTAARVLSLVGDITGCTLWRVWQPVAELQRRQYPAAWAHLDDPLTAEVVTRAPWDALVLNRRVWPRAERAASLRWFEAIHRAGIAVIYEVDDDMFSDDYERFLVDVREFTPALAAEMREGVHHAVQMADGVTVSSRRLATIVRSVTKKPVVVVENAIDWPWFRAVQAETPRKVPGLTIGWAGGKRDDDDVAAMAVAWGRIARRYPHVRFVIQGHHPQIFYDHVPKARIAPIEWLPLESYPAGVKQIDIGCAPLADRPFNRAKTYIKALEYGATGAAVVASPTVYGQIVRHGSNGLIATTADEWEEALSALIDDHSLRLGLAAALAADVKRHYSLEANVLKWAAAWAQIVEEFKQRTRWRLYVPALGGAVRA